jgi:glycosyltransferase involved in cell wall biosynthesis
MIESKGYLDVLEACRLICERGIPILCNFCGSFMQTITEPSGASVREAEAAFRRRIQEHGLSGVVRYHGPVTGAAKLNVLQEAHVFVLPTWYEWEGQPVSIIEALAFGTPVVATRFRGIPEQVIHGYNGMLIDANQPAQIADAVASLWRDPLRYGQMSKNALLHFEQHFTRRAHLERLTPIVLGCTDE